MRAKPAPVAIRRFQISFLANGQTARALHDFRRNMRRAVNHCASADQPITVARRRKALIAFRSDAFLLYLAVLGLVANHSQKHGLKIRRRLRFGVRRPPAAAQGHPYPASKRHHS
jgi:hypothetical protein